MWFPVEGSFAILNSVRRTPAKNKKLTMMFATKRM
jgi:hypothetical protein